MNDLTSPAASWQARKLTKRAIDMMEEPDHERIAHVQKDVFIPYKRATEVLDAMERLLKAPTVIRPRNMLLLAKPNNGKSSLLREFLRRHPGEERIEEDNVHLPVIFVQAPPEPRRTDFEDSLLGAMRLDAKNVADKKSVICSQLQKMNTRMILIDEVNALLVGSANSQRKLLNNIKYISNESRTSIVLAGAPETYNAVQLDDHTQTRFPTVLMKRWTASSHDFRTFLASYESILPLRQPSGLHKLNKVFAELTQLVLGNVVTLIQDSAIAAIERRQPDAECITEELLRQCATTRDVMTAEMKQL
ncbi:MAG: TniB family NTP-binding protein [Xylophilus ampelinus]